jgi:hypothetical protein
LNSILEESLHVFEPEPEESNTSQHQENILSDTNIACSKQSTYFVEDTDSNSSEKSTLPDMNVNAYSSVKQQCLNVQILERNSSDREKCSDKFNVTVKRQKPIEVYGRKSGCIAVTWQSLSSNRENCTDYAEEQQIENETNNYLTKSKYSVSKCMDSIHNTTVGDRRRCSCPYETASIPARNEQSNEHVPLFESKVNISVDNNENVHITFSNNSKHKPPDTSVISTDSYHLCTPDLSENLTYSGTEPSCVKDGNTERSVHDKLNIKNCKICNNFLKPSKTQKQFPPSLGLQCTNCDKLSQQHTTDEQLQTRSVLINRTSAPPPLNLLFVKVEAIPFKNDLNGNELLTESESCAHEENREVYCTHLTKEEKCSVTSSLLSSKLRKYGSPASDIPSSMPQNISSTQETAVKESCISEKLPRHEKKKFISSYDFGCLSTLYEPRLPLQKENTRLDEIYNHYEPMNESNRRNYNKLKPVNLYESLDWKVTGTNRTECNISVDDCGNIYEECKPRDTNNMNTNNRMLSTYDVPLYKTYNSGDVSYHIFMFSSAREAASSPLQLEDFVIHMKLPH